MSQSRPAIAIIANSCPPYRLHLHRRIAREIPQVRLLSAFTHAVSNSPWELRVDDEIGAKVFGPNESCTQQGNPRFALHEWRKGGRIIRWMRENNVRTVVVLGYNDLGRLRIIRWCRNNHVPVFIWGDSNIHSDFAAGMRSIIKKMLVSRVIRACNGVMPCGSLGVSYFKKYGARDDQIFLMPYEPDYEAIRQIGEVTIQQTCHQFGLARNRRRVVFSGRLSDEKRVDLLIAAFAKIAPQRPEWDLLIIGDGERRQSLEALVPFDLKARITWTGFIDNQQAVNALYRASDVLVLPSDLEPWAVVINEAAAAGLAIIASDVVGAAAELVRDGVNGLIFPRADLAQLTQCLAHVTDPARIDAMKSASADVLADWRRRGDPIQGLRKALKFVGVLDTHP